MSIADEARSSDARASDVVIVGAGAIGAAIAWRAAEAGMSVALVDPDPGRGASWVAAGFLAPVTEVNYGEEALLELSLASARLYPDFVAALADATEMTTGYRACGMLMVGRDADENVALDDLFAFQSKLGLDVERLSGAECRALEPALAPTVRGGIRADGDHQVDPRALGAALMEACRRGGVRIVPQGVREVHVSGGRAAGVTLDDGSRVASGATVIAAGCRSAEISGVPEEARAPVRPVKGQLLHLNGPAFLERNLRSLDVYVLPRADGRVVVGATVEERGFDLSVTAEAIYTLLRDAYEIVPGILEHELVETIAGLRPGTPDNLPIIGESALPDLLYATGHYRSGILLTPVTADLIVDLLTGSGSEVPEAFSPRRFARPQGAAS